MEVQGTSSIGASKPITQVRPKVSVEQTPSVGGISSPQDQVDISPMGKMMGEASQASGIRQERLAQIKAAIDAGTYDTPEKLEMALSRMLGQIAQDDA